MPDLTVTGAVDSGRQACEAAAGVTPSEIDVVQLYDAFTINTILFLEDLGFCSKGEGGRFVENASTGPGGVLPVNTNGGVASPACTPECTACSRSVEAVMQLRGSGRGARQVEGAKLALCHGNGGVLSRPGDEHSWEPKKLCERRKIHDGSVSGCESAARNRGRPAAGRIRRTARMPPTIPYARKRRFGHDRKTGFFVVTRYDILKEVLLDTEGGSATFRIRNDCSSRRNGPNSSEICTRRRDGIPPPTWQNATTPNAPTDAQTVRAGIRGKAG